MTRPHLLTRRVALPVTAALVGGTFAAVGLSAPAQAGGSQTVSKNFDYTCSVVVGGLDLNKHVVGVKATAKVPATVFRGERIAPTPVNITLTMPETLRNATVLLVGGTHADGKSTDSAITLTSAGRSLTVRIPSLAAPKTAIPTTVGAPWLIPATGTVPAITTPKYVSGTVGLNMPKNFSITATVYTANENAPASLTCTTTEALGLATLRQVNAAPKAPKKMKVVTKQGKAKKFRIKAKDADGNRLTFKAAKVKKKAGKVRVKGKVLTFKPRKKFKGKSSVIITTRDGKGGIARTKVNLVVKKKR